LNNIDKNGRSRKRRIIGAVAITIAATGLTITERRRDRTAKRTARATVAALTLGRNLK
jgi:hypothetical protein